MDTENPLHVETIPVANVVNRIEVEGEILIEPKIENRIEHNITICETIQFLVEISFAILLFVGFIGGIVALLCWMSGLFGPE
jgi:hypothetical protein